MDEKAEDYHKQGIRLFCAGQLEEAVEFYSKAIKIDPQFPNAYHNRGIILQSLNRIIEGNTDIQRAKDLRSGKIRGKSSGNPCGGETNKTVRLNWEEVENICDTIFLSDSQDLAENDSPEFYDSHYDDLFSDTSFETNEACGELVKPTPETHCYPAILEFVNGKRLEVARARLFEPTNNDVSIIREDGYAERLIPLEHIACIRMAGKPSKLNKNKNSLCYAENIETVDGIIYHEAVHPEQDFDNVLFGFSTKEQTRFIYSFIPSMNIKKRCQVRYIGEILLDMRFIENDILQHAVIEHQKTKTTKLGKIIAQKTKVLYSAIEDELEQAKQAKVQDGFKTGEILLTSGLVNKKQVLEALKHQEYLQNMKIGQFLVEKGIVQEEEVCIALAEKFRIPFVDLKKEKVSRKTLTLLSKNFILQNEILPISFDNDILTVATLNPDVSDLHDATIKECKCKDVQFVLTQPTHLRVIIDLLDKKNGLGVAN